MTTEKSAKERLMGYPKEVLVEYFLTAYLFEPDWRQLDIRANQLARRKLLDQHGQLIEESKSKIGPHAKRSEWWAIQEKILAIEVKLDALDKEASKLFGWEASA